MISIINKLIGYVGRFWYEHNHINWLATFYFNLRQLPFSEAIHLPVYVYFGTNLIDLSGRIIFKCPIKRGIILIGKKWTRSQGRTKFQNRGEWIIEGDNIICQGTQIMIMPSAIFHTGKNVKIRECCYIAVTKKVFIGDNSAIAYSCQIMDSDFHYMLNVDNRESKPIKKSVIIGANNWIGSYTTIKKGTRTPKNCVVASSYAVLSKDYTGIIPPNSVIGGIPAKLIQTNFRRVFNMESQTKLSNYYSYPNDVFVLDENENIDVFCD